MVTGQLQTVPKLHPTLKALRKYVFNLRTEEKLCCGVAAEIAIAASTFNKKKYIAHFLRLFHGFRRVFFSYIFMNEFIINVKISQYPIFI